MKRRTLMILLAALVLVGTAALLEAQRGRQGRNGRNGGFGGFGGFGGGRNFRYGQNEPPPDSEFIFARLRYTAHGKFGGSGWSHDYPTAEEHINQIMAEATGVHVESTSYRIVDLSSPEIFQYPFLYISEAGEMDLTDKEVLNFREYIDRGGFVMVDDFDGIPDLTVFRHNMQRVFPERDIFPMPDDYPLLHIFYDIDELEVLAPYDVAGKPTFYGFPDGHGGTSMFICYNNDVGDFWEWIDQPRYALKPGAEALRLGINMIIYAMTH